MFRYLLIFLFPDDLTLIHKNCTFQESVNEAATQQTAEMGPEENVETMEILDEHGMTEEDATQETVESEQGMTQENEKKETI